MNKTKVLNISILILSIISFCAFFIEFASFDVDYFDANSSVAISFVDY